jgi:hypothetical protein
MTRSRITVSLDEELKIMNIRYIGTLNGDEVNSNMMSQLVHVPHVWEYDSILDMRRYEGTIMGKEIEDLSTRWNELVRGRDAGGFTAIISDDPLVRARLSLTQALFPQRTLENFNTFDEGMDWIKTQKATALVQQT